MRYEVYLPYNLCRYSIYVLLVERYPLRILRLVATYILLINSSSNTLESNAASISKPGGFDALELSKVRRRRSFILRYPRVSLLLYSSDSSPSSLTIILLLRRPIDCCRLQYTLLQTYIHCKGGQEILINGGSKRSSDRQARYCINSHKKMTTPTPRKHQTTTTPSTPSFPSNPFTSYPKSPRIIQYFNRSSRSSKKTISTNDLPFESNSRGILSPTGIFFALVKMTVPLAYIYILLILWRELCYSFPKTMMESEFMNHYFYYLVLTAQTMRSSSLLVEVWAVIEGIFYVILYFHRMWLNSLDTLELSLLSAPMLEIG